MATWNGTPKKFTMECYNPADFGYSHYEDVEWGWNYGTVSDTFRHYTQEEGKDKKWGDILGKLEATAMLYVLAEWYNNYEGSHELDEMIAEIRKSRG